MLSSSDHPDERVVQASRGLAFSVRRGQRLRILNRHGTQVLDTWALASHDRFEHASMDHTRSVNSSIFVDAGMRVVSNRRRTMFTLVEDGSPGRHDTLLCPCSPEIYAELGCAGHHRSCTENFHEALAALGLDLPFTPASLNLFMNVPVAADGALDRLPPRSAAGDHLVLRAEMDLVAVFSACPQDVTPINGAARTPRDVAIAVLPPAGGGEDGR